MEMWWGVWRGEGRPLWLLRSGARKPSYVTECDSKLWLDVTHSSSNPNLPQYTCPLNPHSKLAAPRYVCNRPYTVKYLFIHSKQELWKIVCYQLRHLQSSVTLLHPCQFTHHADCFCRQRVAACPASYCKFHQSTSVTHNSTFDLLFAVSQVRLKHPLVC